MEGSFGTFCAIPPACLPPCFSTNSSNCVCPFTNKDYSLNHPEEEFWIGLTTKDTPGNHNPFSVLSYRFFHSVENELLKFEFKNFKDTKGNSISVPLLGLLHKHNQTEVGEICFVFFLEGWTSLITTLAQNGDHGKWTHIPDNVVHHESS